MNACVYVVLYMYVVVHVLHACDCEAYLYVTSTAHMLLCTTVLQYMVLQYVSEKGSHKVLANALGLLY